MRPWDLLPKCGLTARFISAWWVPPLLIPVPTPWRQLATVATSRQTRRSSRASISPCGHKCRAGWGHPMERRLQARTPSSRRARQRPGGDCRLVKVVINTQTASALSTGTERWVCAGRLRIPFRAFLFFFTPRLWKWPSCWRACSFKRSSGPRLCAHPCASPPSQPLCLVRLSTHPLLPPPARSSAHPPAHPRPVQSPWAGASSRRLPPLPPAERS